MDLECGTIQYRNKDEFIYFYGLKEVAQAKFNELKRNVKTMNMMGGDTLVLKSHKNQTKMKEFIDIKRGIEGIQFVELC